MSDELPMSGDVFQVLDTFFLLSIPLRSLGIRLSFVTIDGEATNDRTVDRTAKPASSATQPLTPLVYAVF